MRNTNMTVKDLRTLADMLTTRMEDFTARKEDRVQKLLADPTDKNVEKQLTFIHEAEKNLDMLWHVMREIKFDIEDITGEPEA